MVLDREHDAGAGELRALAAGAQSAGVGPPVDGGVEESKGETDEADEAEEAKDAGDDDSGEGGAGYTSESSGDERGDGVEEASAEAAAAPPAVADNSAMFERLFRAVSTDTCAELCRAAEPAGADLGTSMSHVYGEVRYRPMLRLLRRACRLRAAKGDAPPASFVDLGCGSGRAVLAAALTCPSLRDVRGVEFVPALHAVAERLASYYHKLFVPKLGTRWAGQRVAQRSERCPATSPPRTPKTRSQCLR